MANALVPEFTVTNLGQSLSFYCDVIGFDVVYTRPEDGFAYLRLGEAELMLDQIDLGRTFDGVFKPTNHPYGKGLNLQLRVDAVEPLARRLNDVGAEFVLSLEEKWYRADTIEVGHRQFCVADPDGYLLRFYQSLGQRELTARPAGR